MPARSRGDLPALPGRAGRLAPALLPLVLALPAGLGVPAAAATAPAPDVAALAEDCGVVVTLPDATGVADATVAMTVQPPSAPAGRVLQLSDGGRWEPSSTAHRVWRLDLTGVRTADPRGHRLRVDVQAEGRPPASLALWLPACLPGAGAATASADVPTPAGTATPTPAPDAAAAPAPASSPPAAGDPSPAPAGSTPAVPSAEQPAPAQPDDLPVPAAPEEQPAATGAGAGAGATAEAAPPAALAAPAAPRTPEARPSAPAAGPAAPAAQTAPPPVAAAVPPHLLGEGTSSDPQPQRTGGVGVATAPALEAVTAPSPAAPAPVAVPAPQVAPDLPDEEQPVALERAASRTGLPPVALERQSAVEELLPGTSGLALVTAGLAAALVRRRAARA